MLHYVKVIIQPT